MCGAGVKHWVAVAGPGSIDRLFAGGTIAPLEAVLAHAPLPAGARRAMMPGSERIAEALERRTRSTLAEIVTAARYAGWLAVAPFVAFLLLTAAPAFQRSGLRVLPHGHLQWRAEEDPLGVNTPLAGDRLGRAAAALIPR